METTFYQSMMKYTDYEANDPMSRLANTMHKDIAFPKQAREFDEISKYMEENSNYSKLLSVFDDAWTNYQY